MKEKLTRRGFLGGVGTAAVAGSAMAGIVPARALTPEEANPATRVDMYSTAETGIIFEATSLIYLCSTSYIPPGLMKKITGRE